MALPTTATYTTLAEFQAFTRVTSQKTILEADWQPSALHAEWIVDEYIGYVKPFDAVTPQVMKFPTIDADGNSTIPDDIIKATIEITADLILKGDQVATADGTVKKEKWASTGYEKDLGTGEITPENLNLYIPPLAKRLLRKYLGGSGKFTY